MALPRFNKGADFFKEVTADKLNAMCDAIDTNKILPSHSLLVSQYPRVGTGIEARSSKGGVSATSTSPFQIVVTTSMGSPALQVVFGTVTDPTGSPITPTGMTAGDVPPFLLTITENSVIVLSFNLTTYGYIDTGAGITISAMSTLPSNTIDWGAGTGTIYAQIGSVSYASSVISILTQDILGNIGFLLAGDFPILFQTS
jgi:hypothetical protein